MNPRDQAAKLLNDLNQVKELSHYHAAKQRLFKYAASHPEPFIELLNLENADSIGSALRGCGETGLDLLRQLIESGETPRIYAALRALWEFEEDAESEVPLLESLLTHADSEVRWRAVHALARIGEPARPAGTSVLRVAEEGSEQEKTSALYALRRMEYDPLLLEHVCRDLLLSGSEPAAVHSAAIDTLEEIEADPNPIVGSLITILESSEGRSTGSSLLNLLERCDYTPFQKRRVITALESIIQEDPPHKSKHLEVLWRLNPGNATVFQIVTADLQSDDWQMESACDVMCELKEHAAPFVPLLIAQLEKHQGNWDFCWAAVDAINQIGPPALAAKPLLEKMRSHPSELVKARVEFALASIEGRTEPRDDFEGLLDEEED